MSRGVPQSTIATDDSLRERSAWLAVVVTLAALPFVPALSGEFLVYDDGMMIVENTALWSEDALGWLDYWRRPYFDIYAPVTYSSLWLLARFDTLLGFPTPDARVFHTASLVLHAACAGMVYLLAARQVTRRSAAAAGALVFAWHPLQVETVAWATEIKTQLAGVFGLAAALLFVSSGDQHRGKHMARRVVATLCFLAALGSKPTAAVIPLLALVAETSWNSRKRTLPWMVPWLFAAVALMVVTRQQQSDELLRHGVSIPWRPWVATDATACYLANLLCPWNLVPDYGRTPAFVIESGVALRTWIAPLGMAAIVVLVPGLAFLRRPLVWAAIALLPNSGLAPFLFQDISTVADRYANLALVGIAWAVAAILVRLPSRAAVMIAMSLLGVMAPLTFRQTLRWRDDRTLFAYTLSVNPQSGLALVNLGLVELRAGNRPDAAARFHEAALRNPNDELALYNLGVLAQEDRRSTEAEDLYRRAQDAARGRLPQAAENLASLLLELGRYEDARDAARTALRTWPANGRLTAAAAQSLMALGDREAARRYAHDAARLSPRNADVMGVTADILADLRDYTAATEFYRRALELRPAWPEVAASYAWLMATCEDARFRDGATALRLAEQACREAQELHPEFLGTLAAAQAESGDFRAAISTQERALDQARRTGRADFLPSGDKRLATYRAGRPWREVNPP